MGMKAEPWGGKSSIVCGNIFLSFNADIFHSHKSLVEMNLLEPSESGTSSVQTLIGLCSLKLAQEPSPASPCSPVFPTGFPLNAKCLPVCSG